jgi:D-aminopeptidase
MSADTVSVDFDERKIDAIFAELNQCGLPGAAVGIAIGGRPVYRKGFGLASMELPVALSPSVRMRIGSATKHFACLAYALLSEEGKCGFDDRIHEYLPELHPVVREISVRQLMGHIGGLPDAYDISMQLSGTGRSVTTSDLLSFYRDIDDLSAAPGTAWRYNNGGYVMLSVAIERIAGQSLEEVLCERIFSPVGMHDTRLRRWDSDFVPNSATLHMSTLAGGFEKSYLGTEFTGEGGMVSTVDDMLRWLAHMQAPAVGTPSTWKTMKTPQTLANGTSTGYGLGLMMDRYRGVETIAHSGGVMGGNSQMLKVPAANLDVVIMLNRHDVSGVQLVNEILDTCLQGLEPIKETRDRRFVMGTFRSPTSGRVIQLSVRKDKQIASIDGTDLPMEPDEQGVLRPPPALSLYKFTLTLVGDRTKPGALRFTDFGDVDELVEVTPPDGAGAPAIFGRYRSKWTGTDVTIRRGDQGPRLLSVGRFGSATYELECLANRLWRATSTTAMPLGGILTFDPDGSAFRLRTARSVELTFRRDA